MTQANGRHESLPPKLIGFFNVDKATDFADHYMLPRQSVMSSIAAERQRFTTEERGDRRFIKKALKAIDFTTNLDHNTTVVRTDVLIENAADQRQRSGLTWHIDAYEEETDKGIVITPTGFIIAASCLPARFLDGSIDFSPALTKNEAPDGIHNTTWLLENRYDEAVGCIDEALQTGDVTIRSFREPGSVIQVSPGSIHIAVKAIVPPFTDIPRLVVGQYLQ